MIAGNYKEAVENAKFELAKEYALELYRDLIRYKGWNVSIRAWNLPFAGICYELERVIEDSKRCIKHGRGFLWIDENFNLVPSSASCNELEETLGKTVSLWNEKRISEKIQNGLAERISEQIIKGMGSKDMLN
jgi:hypothetical protein